MSSTSTSKAHAIACAIADGLTRVNGNPVTVMLLAPLCALFVFVGWMLDELQLALLTLTSVLSVQASLMGCIAALRLRKQDGEL